MTKYEALDEAIAYLLSSEEYKKEITAEKVFQIVNLLTEIYTDAFERGSTVVKYEVTPRETREQKIEKWFEEGKKMINEWNQDNIVKILKENRELWQPKI